MNFILFLNVRLTRISDLNIYISYYRTRPSVFKLVQLLSTENVKVQIKTTKCRSPCDLYISKNVSKHYAREKCEHINNKSTIQN